MTKNNLKVVKSTKDQELDNKEKNKALDAAISQITDNFGDLCVWNVVLSSSFLNILWVVSFLETGTPLFIREFRKSCAHKKAGSGIAPLISKTPLPLGIVPLIIAFVPNGAEKT